MKIYRDKLIHYSQYCNISEIFRKKRLENLLFCEHYPVITAGIQFKKESFRVTVDYLKSQNIPIFYTKRGGDLTAHEPGQIIIYPHIDLKKRKISISNFINFSINLTQELLQKVFNVHLIYIQDMPGLYTQKNEKVVSIGFEIRKGFSTSGIAINFINDLKTFTYIYPCGYKDLSMKTMKEITKINREELLHKKEIFIDLWIEKLVNFLNQYT